MNIDEKPLADIAHLEQKLGVPEGLFFQLRDENDWSFLIKVFALLETALAFLIKTELQRKELDTFIEKLPFKGRSSKVSLIQALDLLDPLHHRYLDLLGEFRNDMAHDIKYAGFDLSKHLSTYTDKQLHKFLVDAACLPNTFEFSMSKEIRAWILETPRLFLWRGAMDCLTLVYLKDQIAEQQAVMQTILNTTYQSAPLGGLQQLALANALRNYPPQKGLLHYEPEPTESTN